jgi:hypothetical protein
MLEVLFPLYLTLSGHESPTDKAAAIEGVRQLIASKTFGPIISGINANVPSRLSKGFELPSPGNAVAFLQWFKELSATYTKLLGPGLADPFQT